jgi:hypothetical protein
MADAEGPGFEELRARIAVIERDIDGGRYRPGPWADLLGVLRNRPNNLRSALAADLSRVSRKLHLRRPRRTIPVRAGIWIEIAASVIGAVLLAYAIAFGSNGAAIATMAIWVMSLQPLLKVGVGTVLGVGYDYVYLNGLEPRFKMTFGSYLAAARWKRIVLHMSGMVGSPLGAIIVAQVAAGRLRFASIVSAAAFWIVVAINVIPMIAATSGVRRLGPIKTGEGSCGAAGIELREALGLGLDS